MRKTIINSLMFLLLCSPALAATQVIRYVDTDVVGGLADGTSRANAYSDLGLADNAEEKDISQATGSDEQFTFLCFGVAAQTGGVNWGGGAWTTQTATGNYIEVIGDNPTGGYSTSHYRIEKAGTGMTVGVNDIRFHHVQWGMTSTGSSNTIAVQLTGTLGAGVHIYDSCIFKCASTSTGLVRAIMIADASPTIKIHNCTFSDWVNGANSDHIGVWSNVAGITRIHNNTFFDCWRAVNIGSGTDSVVNNICGNITDENEIVAASAVIAYNMTDTGNEGTNEQTPLDGDWDKEMMDPSNGDFRLVAGGNWANGNDNPFGYSDYLDDIIGTTRTSTWSIGAYEEVGMSGQIMGIISKGFQKDRKRWEMTTKQILYGPLNLDGMNFAA